jgi:hypothetical protein
MSREKCHTVVGIDNGLDGGLVALSEFTGHVIAKRPMPTRQINGKREVDPHAIREWIFSLNEKPSRLLVAIEEPLKHAKSSQAIRSMGVSFGILSATSELGGARTCRVQVRNWQDSMLGKAVPQGKTKEHALKYANKRWPNEDWLASPRCSVPHDGMVDAAVIAEYARLNLLS